ncbi:cell division protein SepF [Ruminococcus sp.]|uniref:cell division protein SepF n=1 Tax=Ruminococcus sp. TaxID=41978 RepID=UPI0025DADE5D|nr:cell division protein SepF [Ruminococcus sp.]MBO4524580.1 cell division protein SepF [Ruminococcus sp.]
MKLFENIKEFFFAEEDDDFDADVPVRHERGERSGFQPSAQDDAPVNESGLGGGMSRERRNKVVNIQTTAQLQVVLVKPSAFTDAKQIADHLIAKKTVVLNLETASPENKRRIIDFLVGVAYANGGSLKPVANLTYIITPYNVGFIGEDLVGELENNGVFI